MQEAFSKFLTNSQVAWPMRCLVQLICNRLIIVNDAQSDRRRRRKKTGRISIEIYLEVVVIFVLILCVCVFVLYSPNALERLNVAVVALQTYLSILID